MADWSDVTWLIYESPGGGCRVVPPRGKKSRPLSAGELRPGERLAGSVVGCSRATVLAALKAGVKPGAVQQAVAGYAEAQSRREQAAGGKRRAA